MIVLRGLAPVRSRLRDAARPTSGRLTAYWNLF